MATKKHSKLKSYLASNYVEFAEDQTSMRLNSLYSDFSKSHTVNPYAYEANVEFWRAIVLDCNQQGYLRTPKYATAINKHTIAEDFRRPLKGKPLALDCVLEHMEKKGDLMTIDKFIQTYTFKATWAEWFYHRLSPSRYWHSSSEDHFYVIMPTIELIAKHIISEHFEIPTKRTTDHLFTLSAFKHKYAHHFVNEIDLTEDDIMLVLRYLHIHYGIAVEENVKGYGTTYQVIKFPSRQGEIADITKHDEAMISIQTTCHALSIQIDELQKKIEEFERLSVEEHKKGHKAKSLYYIRKRKGFQQVLEKRIKSMETMDNILMKIETSHDDLQVVQAFNVGADTLRDLLGQDGLSIETINDVMEKVSNSLQDQNEIEEAMQSGMNDTIPYNDQEIEAELAQLIEKEEPVVEAKENKEVNPVIDNNNNNIQSELARLNQMFVSSDHKKQKEAVLN
ncbi:uncharacterized protein RHIMIDRAFT_235328 [Rhizopus microsporus ATCC 52813]|uniref:Charged multivesicular body protein 7 n=2 Tax=Rhizopus microsporus TaxID=58291 RepID=A0A2G4T0K9_RHIZD|nr:uncharacterized protein RHIMIDRAFT_235328 [Rhizopus microsporus ATCC 52813]PHZ14555.1 hypothetical protein RHIMIDRAFT_235328 [Rhizopus microsporus ATCC 52813]